jgi:hypothetical protein
MAPRSMDWGQQESRCHREGDAESMANDDPNITSKASYLRDDEEASTAYGYWTLCDLSQLAGPANRGARPTPKAASSALTAGGLEGQTIAGHPCTPSPSIARGLGMSLAEGGGATNFVSRSSSMT